jgi:hypothetical protein
MIQAKVERLLRQLQESGKPHTSKEAQRSLSLVRKTLRHVELVGRHRLHGGHPGHRH